MKNKSLLPYFVVPALPLLVPLIAMRFTEEVQWTISDFVIAYVLLAGAGFIYRLVTMKADCLAHRVAAALGAGTGLLLIWVNLAVGFIGSEDNPANLLYGAVVAVGLIGAALARLEPQRMSAVLFATAATQFLVPVIAWLIWRPGFDLNVLKIFILNGVFVVLFIVSGLLFRVNRGKPGQLTQEGVTA
jgi:hypothetical protein